MSFRKFSVCCEKTCSCTVTMPNPSWVSHQPGKNNMKIVLKCSDIELITFIWAEMDQNGRRSKRAMLQQRNCLVVARIYRLQTYNWFFWWKVTLKYVFSYRPFYVSPFFNRTSTLGEEFSVHRKDKSTGN